MTPSPRNTLPFHKKNLSTSTSATLMHPPQSSFARKWRKEVLAGITEFMGTFMFLFFSFVGTQVALTAGQPDGTPTKDPDASVLIYVALAFGFSLLANVWLFYRISGGLFNPSVTLGLFLVGAVTPIRAVICFVAQMLGGMAAAGVVSALLPGPLSVATTLGDGVSITRGVFIEMFLTALLVFTIFMLAVEKHKATYLAPVGIGLSFFIAELSGVKYTGGSLNPARSFGPCVATRNFTGYQYIYWCGPLMGTLLAFGMYKMIKLMEYQTVNPGQDFDDHESALFKPPEHPSMAHEVGRPIVAAVVVEEMMRAGWSGGGQYSGVGGGMGADEHTKNGISAPTSRVDEERRDMDGVQKA